MRLKVTLHSSHVKPDVQQSLKSEKLPEMTISTLFLARVGWSDKRQGARMVRIQDGWWLSGGLMVVRRVGGCHGDDGRRNCYDDGGYYHGGYADDGDGDDACHADLSWR